VIASLTDCLTTIANIGISYFVAIASILNLSIPIPPIAAPNPSATLPESSPSSFYAASIIIMSSGLSFSTIDSVASPGLPTVAYGPSAFNRINFLSLNSDSL